MKNRYPVLGLFVLVALAGCSHTVPCPVCYEDEWSKHPFPGQQTQHIKPLTPEDVENEKTQRQQGNAPDPIVQEFMGSSAADMPF